MNSWDRFRHVRATEKERNFQKKNVHKMRSFGKNGVRGLIWVGYDGGKQNQAVSLEWGKK